MTNPLVPDDEARAWDSIRKALGKTGPLDLDSSLVPGVEPFDLNVQRSDAVTESPELEATALADAFSQNYRRLVAAKHLDSDAMGLVFADFGLRGPDVSGMVRLRVRSMMERLHDDEGRIQASEQGVDGEEYTEILCCWLALEMLGTGLWAGRLAGESS